jgi:hypothetical protein
VSALLLVAVVATAGALVRLARARCSCQRDDPLAGLGALGTVTARVRRSRTRSTPTRSTRTTEEHPWR